MIDKHSDSESVDKQLAGVPTFTKHNSTTRHVTGKSKQESLRESQRLADDEEVTADQLEDHVVVKITNNRKTRAGLQYETVWESDPTNPTWEPSVNFTTKDVLIEYWKQQPKDAIPRKYKKLLAKATKQ